MERHLRMGAWTGLLAGVVTAGVVLVADLVAGGGLDGAARFASLLGLAFGVVGVLLAVVIGVPLLVVVLGLALAVLPIRLAGVAAGLGLGLIGGLALAALLSAARPVAALDLPALSPVLFGSVAGLVLGFLYSRYARTVLRPPSLRPFGRR